MFLIKGHLISYNNILFNQYSNRLNHLQIGKYVWSVSKYFSKIEADCQTVYTLIKHELSDLVYTACFGISVTILKCSVVNLFFAFCYFTDAAQTQEYWNYCKWKEKKKDIRRDCICLHFNNFPMLQYQSPNADFLYFCWDCFLVINQIIQIQPQISWVCYDNSRISYVYFQYCFS